MQDEPIQLWHVTVGDKEKINSIYHEGLNPNFSQNCIGGQEKGIHFFTRRSFAQDWIQQNYYSFHEKGTYYLCCYNVLPKQITYPHFKLDLFFSRELIGIINQSLEWNLNKNNEIPLNLNSQYAIMDYMPNHDYFFKNYPVKLISVQKKENKFFLNYQDKNILKIQELNPRISNEYLGFMDTLCDYLCRHHGFLNIYNMFLKKQLRMSYKSGVVKYMGNECLPIIMEKYYNHVFIGQYRSRNNSLYINAKKACLSFCRKLSGQETENPQKEQ